MRLALGDNPEKYGLTEEDWRRILLEYTTLIVTEKSKNIFTCYQRWFYTHWKVAAVEKLTTFLKVAHDTEIAAALQELGYDLVEYKEDREEYLKQIYLIETEAKTLVVLLNQYSKEYETLCEETDSNIKRDEMFYQKELAILSRHQGYRIKPEKITVFQWAAIVNAYIEYHELGKPKNEGDGESV